MPTANIFSINKSIVLLFECIHPSILPRIPLFIHFTSYHFGLLRSEEMEALAPVLPHTLVGNSKHTL